MDQMIFVKLKPDDSTGRWNLLPGFQQWILFAYFQSSAAMCGVALYQLSCRHKIPAGEVAMHRIESSGDQFVVIDPFDEVVDWFATEDAAEQSIAHCQKQDAMHGSAKLLIESAVTAHSECGVGEPSEAVGTSIRSTAQLSGVRRRGSSTGRHL
jgi:hypothetical protein